MGKSLAQEKWALLEAKEASEVRIRELEEDIKTLTQRTVERETALERSGILLFSLLLFLCAVQSSNANICLSLTKSVCAG